jgi:hypothetical protein
MGMSLRLYGCIVEYALGPEDLNDSIRKHNETVIQHIKNSQQVLFEKEMFFINSAADNYGGRLIHFGGNSRDWMANDPVKSWKLWLSEFEGLLTKLYWLEADVHFKPEYASVQSFFWRIDLKKWSPHTLETVSQISPTDWDFEGKIDWGN